MRIFMKLNRANAVVTRTITEQVPVLDADGNYTYINEELVTEPVTTEELDWLYALKKAARNVQELNAISGVEPIYANPDAINWVEELDGVPAHWEGRAEEVFGNGGFPSETGKLEIDIPNYSCIELDLMPAMPTTFTFILGTPRDSGKLLS